MRIEYNQIENNRDKKVKKKFFSLKQCKLRRKLHLIRVLLSFSDKSERGQKFLQYCSVKENSTASLVQTTQ